MRIIVLGDEFNRSHSLEFPLQRLYWIAGGLLALLLFSLVTLWVAIERGQRVELAQQELVQMQEQNLFEQQRIDEFYTYSDNIFTEHARQAGALQARLARLEALGGRLAEMADFDEEFNFYEKPAYGGPYLHATESLEVGESRQQAGSDRANIRFALGQLDKQLAQRELELGVLEELLVDKQLSREQYLAGKPVSSGWLSSNFGKRIDPFHGKVAWHKGVDFAGKDGDEILAVASGVVVWSGERYGYGTMVEIDHGNGFATRYGHNKLNSVKLGDVVSKGQTIAQMGSSGRSTGPHVHFEVLRHGKAVDPARYIYRKTL